VTSPQLRGVNRHRDDCDCKSVNVGGGVSSVAVRIDVTFDSIYAISVSKSCYSLQTILH